LLIRCLAAALSETKANVTRRFRLLNPHEEATVTVMRQVQYGDSHLVDLFRIENLYFSAPGRSPRLSARRTSTKYQTPRAMVSTNHAATAIAFQAAGEANISTNIRKGMQRDDSRNHPQTLRLLLISLVVETQEDFQI
jgi:hypothetical protein